MHRPVLVKEVLEYLDPESNENFIDCTIGEGGHAFAILEKTMPKGILLGIDWDEQQIKNLELKRGEQRLEKRLILVHDNFVNIKNIIRKYRIHQIKGILFDLGMCSWHLEESGRGFSFLRDEPLDMRYNRDSKFKIQNSKLQTKVQEVTAEKIVNEYSQETLEHLLREYGEERFAKRVAREIVRQRKTRPIKSTFQLVEIVRKATPRWYHRQRIHFATRTFQALRIAVNDELGNLSRALLNAFEVLAPRGRLATISFHSLEDRIVKRFFLEKAKNGQAFLMTKKPVTPSPREIKENPRARSAKLRVIEKA